MFIIGVLPQNDFNAEKVTFFDFIFEKKILPKNGFNILMFENTAVKTFYGTVLYTNLTS